MNPSITLAANAGGSRALIEVHGVQKVYRTFGGSVTALDGIDLQVFPGEFLVLTGRSGSGKTTLINLVTGLDRCTAGEIVVAGNPIHKFGPEAAAHWRRLMVGVVFQTFELLPTLTVLENVMLPMDFAGRLPHREQNRRAMHLLEIVEIADHARKMPAALSGGQQQRLAIARAMANDPPLLVADEPTGSLDSVTAEAIIEIFDGLVLQGRTVVMATHDRDIAVHGSRFLTLSDGRFVGSEAGHGPHA